MQHTRRGGAALPLAMETIYCIFLCVFYCVSSSFISGVNLAKGNFSNVFSWKTSEALVHFWLLTIISLEESVRSRGVGGVRVVYTHCLADTCMSRLIYSAYKDRAGEGDVEAEVDQHVPKLAAHAHRPGVTEAANNRINPRICWASFSYLRMGPLFMLTLIWMVTVLFLPYQGWAILTIFWGWLLVSEDTIISNVNIMAKEHAFVPGKDK